MKCAEVRKPREEGVEYSPEFIALVRDCLARFLRQGQGAHRAEGQPDRLEALLPGGVELDSRSLPSLFRKQPSLGDEREAQICEREPAPRIKNHCDRRPVLPALDNLVMSADPALFLAHRDHFGPAEVFGDTLLRGEALRLRREELKEFQTCPRNARASFFVHGSPPRGRPGEPQPGELVWLLVQAQANGRWPTDPPA